MIAADNTIYSLLRFRQVEDLSVRLSKDISSIFAILTDEASAAASNRRQVTASGSVGSGGGILGPQHPATLQLAASGGAVSLREAFAHQRSHHQFSSSPRDVSPVEGRGRSPSNVSAGSGAGGRLGLVGPWPTLATGGPAQSGLSDTAVNVLKASPTSNSPALSAGRRKVLDYNSTVLYASKLHSFWY